MKDHSELLTKGATSTRRGFIKRASAAAAGLGAWQALSAERVAGANERVNVAIIGCGGRGRFILRVMIEDAGAHCVAISDLSDERMDQMWTFIQPVQTEKPRFEKDYRKILEAKDIDAVIVATHDNWHAPLTIQACQAGKAVYVEKPHSFCMWESGKMVEAAAKYRRVVQVGTQNRSTEYNLRAREIVQSGQLGEIGLVKVFNLKSGSPFKLGDPGQQPAGFDWDRWLGRAALRPYHQRIWRGGGWHFYWDYCGGDMTDDGIHQIDLALMMMGDPGLPTSVRALGGQFVTRKGDDSEVPDVLNVAWEFPTFAMTFDMSQYPAYMEKSSDVLRKKHLVSDWKQNATRIEIYGQKQLMILGRHGGGFVVEKGSSQVVEKMHGQAGDLEHYRNFIACVKSRKAPNADIAVAHASNMVAHMGNIAHRLGNVALKYDAAANAFDNPAATAMVKASYRSGYEIPDTV